MQNQLPIQWLTNSPLGYQTKLIHTAQLRLAPQTTHTDVLHLLHTFTA